jgi:F-type H+-transporting ATPase subunit gamma
VITGDRGLAGAYNTNVLRFAAQHFDGLRIPVRYIAVGRKGRDLLIRRRKALLADFSNLPAAPTFADVSAVGHLAVSEFEKGDADQVFVVYTDFVNIGRQQVTFKQLLPLELEEGKGVMELQKQSGPVAAYEYEPDLRELLDEIIPRFTALQIYQAILESQASEHAARMVAMHSATDNAKDLAGAYDLQYNKMRQQTITNDILDIVGGAEAQAAEPAAPESGQKTSGGERT